MTKLPAGNYITTQLFHALRHEGDIGNRDEETIEIGTRVIVTRDCFIEAEVAVVLFDFDGAHWDAIFDAADEEGVLEPTGTFKAAAGTTKRYMIQNVRSGEVFVYDPEMEATCGPLHHSDRSAPLADYHCDDDIDAERLSDCCGAPAIEDTEFCAQCRDASGFTAEIDWSDWAILREEETRISDPQVLSCAIDSEGCIGGGKAVALMAQLSDNQQSFEYRGNRWVYLPICSGHYDGWWDGSVSDAFAPPDHVFGDVGTAKTRYEVPA